MGNCISKRRPEADSYGLFHQPEVIYGYANQGNPRQFNDMMERMRNFDSLPPAEQRQLVVDFEQASRAASEEEQRQWRASPAYQQWQQRLRQGTSQETLPRYPGLTKQRTQTSGPPSYAARQGTLRSVRS